MARSTTKTTRELIASLDLDLAAGARSIVRARPYVRISEISKAEKEAAMHGEHRYVSDQMQLSKAAIIASLHRWTYDEGVALDKAYQDLDVSAFRKKYTSRPGIMRHLEDAQNGRFDKLIVLTVSRFGRNLRESLELLERFEAAGVSVYFAHESIDSANESQRFVLNVLLAVAQKSSEDTGMFLRESWRQRALRGEMHGGRLPMWLERRNVGSERIPNVVIRAIPEQADNIRRMVELRIQGTGYAKIARYMNAEGRRTASGRPWTGSMACKYCQESFIESMLGVGFYNRDKIDAKPIAGAYEAVIDEETAQRLRSVQALYEANPLPAILGAKTWNQNTHQRMRPRMLDVNGSRLLSGLVRCSVCDARMIGHTRMPDDRHPNVCGYMCRSASERRELHQDSGLPSSVNSLSIEDAVLRVVRGALDMPPMVPSSKPKVRQKSGRSLETLEMERSKLLLAFTKGLVDETLFEEHMTLLNLERDAIRAETEATCLPERQAAAYALADNPVLTREELRQLVLLMVERVEFPIVVPGFYVRKPCNGLRKMARVTLKFPRADGHRTFLAGLYTSKFGGERVFWPCDNEPQKGVVEDSSTRSRR